MSDFLETCFVCGCLRSCGCGRNVTLFKFGIGNFRVQRGEVLVCHTGMFGYRRRSLLQGGFVTAAFLYHFLHSWWGLLAIPPTCDSLNWICVKALVQWWQYSGHFVKWQFQDWKGVLRHERATVLRVEIRARALENLDGSTDVLWPVLIDAVAVKVIMRNGTHLRLVHRWEQRWLLLSPSFDSTLVCQLLPQEIQVWIKHAPWCGLCWELIARPLSIGDCQSFVAGLVFHVWWMGFLIDLYSTWL